MAGGVLALDLATFTGWAISQPAGPPLFGTQRIGKPHYSAGRFFAAFRRWAAGMIEIERPAAIYYEAPIIVEANGLQAAYRLMGLTAHLEAIAYELGVPRIERLASTAVRKHFTGRGRWADREDGKRRTVDACRARGWNVISDDEADACAVLDLALHRLRQGPLNAGGMFARSAA